MTDVSGMAGAGLRVDMAGSMVYTMDAETAPRGFVFLPGFPKTAYTFGRSEPAIVTGRNPATVSATEQWRAHFVNKDGGAMQYIHANRFCQRCGKRVNARLVRNITQSGVSQVYWYCHFSEHPISKPGTDFIPHEKIKNAGYDPNDLPVINNYSGREVCAVCGSPFTELNHWAPKHLFGDEAESWPKDYLCKHHHDIWHAKVTPNMTKVGSNGNL